MSSLQNPQNPQNPNAKAKAEKAEKEKAKAEEEEEAKNAINNLKHDLVTEMLSIADAERYLGPLVVQNIIELLSTKDIKTFNLLNKDFAACFHAKIIEKKETFINLIYTKFYNSTPYVNKLHLTFKAQYKYGIIPSPFYYIGIKIVKKDEGLFFSIEKKSNIINEVKEFTVLKTEEIKEKIGKFVNLIFNHLPEMLSDENSLGVCIYNTIYNDNSLEIDATFSDEIGKLLELNSISTKSGHCTYTMPTGTNGQNGPTGQNGTNGTHGGSIKKNKKVVKPKSVKPKAVKPKTTKSTK
jgi:hypothetical protein